MIVEFYQVFVIEAEAADSSADLLLGNDFLEVECLTKVNNRLGLLISGMAELQQFSEQDTPALRAMPK